jgi:hypothetical protein
MTPPRVAALAAGTACLALLGCGGGRLAPVTGKVLVDGAPAAGAVVVFNPAANPGTMERKPTAMTRADGTFTVGTLTADDGAAPGDYLVTVVWPGAPAKAKGPPKGLGGEDERVADGGDQLRGRYRDPQTSGLKVAVASGPNALPPFQLQK